MTRTKTLLAVSLGALLTGCATQSQTQLHIDPPTNTEICCSSYAQFPFAQLGDNENIKFDIDLASPVGSFPSGNSHFAAFRFSDRSQELLLTLSSQFVNDSVFAPEVILLNEAFQPVAQYSLEEFQTKAADAFSRTQYVTRFRADAVKTPYMIVYTSAETLGQRITVDHPAKVRAKEFGEAMPMVVDPTYTYQLGGTLGLEVETLKLRPFKANSKTAVAEPVKAKAAVIEAQPETKTFYLNAIQKAVADNDINKALSLLDEAKALGIEDAQEVFVKAVNAK
ncbi:MalM family protein [Vibrio diazotrophicus]|uniref:MalM family protein n=1 Tax=Vibrio diazotrophicus TaxID=685 RepID=UPI00142DCC9C|nr:MalM family protein [Vibrio diazotrophicus]NIY92730.1 transcriptional regulator [Vibrio diazotrophicus]